MTHPCPAVLSSAARTGHTRKDVDTLSESEKRDIETPPTNILHNETI